MATPCVSAPRFTSLHVDRALGADRCSHEAQLPFREDFNISAQVSRCRQQQLAQFQQRLLAEWKTTCATRDAHRHMLLALIAEAARYRAARDTPMSRPLLASLVAEVNNAMSQPEGDQYVALLNKLAHMRLFSASPSFQCVGDE